MSNTIKTQGTHLYLIYEQSDGVIKFDCPTGLTGLGGAADQLEDTCLDATDDKTYKRGLGNPGQVTVPFRLLSPAPASHRLALTSLKDSGDVVRWMVCLSDGTVAPTVDSGDDLEPPANRTSARFSAYVSDVTIDIATNDLVAGTMILQRSGGLDWTFKS